MLYACLVRFFVILRTGYGKMVINASLNVNWEISDRLCSGLVYLESHIEYNHQHPLC